MSVSRKSVKLYADFYSSDIVVASPLGLRRIVGAEGDKQRDIDFLASLEVVYLGCADVMLQQNWQHMVDVFALLNGEPSATRDTDFSRVRLRDLDGGARFHRQTIVASTASDPRLLSLMRNHCQNILGQVSFRGKHSGTIANVVPTVRQVWHRLAATSPVAADDARLKYFKEHILPQLRAATAGMEETTLQPHTLVVVPSYFSFVRIRNFLSKEDADFAPVSE
jgi:U3 small nucleolar RNA-associated protein 25